MNDYIEGYEMMPDWFVEELEAQEFEDYLVSLGYYENVKEGGNS